jgi:hypothetical protein
MSEPAEVSLLRGLDTSGAGLDRATLHKAKLRREVAMP